MNIVSFTTMETLATGAALAVLFTTLGVAQAASGDYLLKLDGVKGEASVSSETSVEMRDDSSATGQGSVRAEASTPSDDSRGSYSDADKDGHDRSVDSSDDSARTPALLEIDGVKGESAGRDKGGKDDDIDEIDDRGSRRATNFGILLGGDDSEESDDGKDDSSDEKLRGLERAQQVLTEKARAADRAIEQISLNFEKITARVKKEVQLFGLVSVTTTADVEIDENEEVHVRYPWWTFLATEKDEETLGLRIKAVLSDVVKAEENTLRDLIQGTR